MTIPLFPLQLVLFPSVPLPLHIFEERYRTLVNRCLDEQTPFGVVYHQGESMKRVGCTALISDVLKRYEDGRMDILTVGGERFEIVSIDDTGLYLEATIRYLHEGTARQRPRRRRRRGLVSQASMRHGSRVVERGQDPFCRSLGGAAAGRLSPPVSPCGCLDGAFTTRAFTNGWGVLPRTPPDLIWRRCRCG